MTASGTVRFAEAQLVDQDGNPTGEKVQSNVHDQVSLSGIIKHGDEDVFVNMHGRFGIASTPGRRLLQWVIDGEAGSIEVANRADGGLVGGPAIGARRRTCSSMARRSK